MGIYNERLDKAIGLIAEARKEIVKHLQSLSLAYEKDCIKSETKYLKEVADALGEAQDMVSFCQSEYYMNKKRGNRFYKGV